MESEKIVTPEFWKSQWESSRKSSFYARKKIRSESETVKFWDDMAPEYGKMTSERSGDRVQRVIELLERDNILTPDARVLDVGCGPGNYALPVARRCTHVTALDSSSGMCDILEKEAENKNQENIKVICNPWGDIDLEKESLDKRFDLVFASMTPAVGDYDSLNKMIRASDRYCCLITTTGKGFGNSRYDIWRKVFQEENTTHQSGFIFIFNLLFSLGYRPVVQYLNFVWDREDPEEKVVKRLLRSLWLYTEITPDITELVTHYVKERSEGGIFREKADTCLGMMVWDVNIKE